MSYATCMRVQLAYYMFGSQYRKSPCWMMVKGNQIIWSWLTNTTTNTQVYIEKGVEIELRTLTNMTFLMCEVAAPICGVTHMRKCTTQNTAAKKHALVGHFAAVSLSSHFATHLAARCLETTCHETKVGLPILLRLMPFLFNTTRRRSCAKPIVLHHWNVGVRAFLPIDQMLLHALQVGAGIYDHRMDPPKEGVFPKRDLPTIARCWRSISLWVYE